jgi:hypothetical protein
MVRLAARAPEVDRGVSVIASRTARRAMKPAKAGPARHVPNERAYVLMAEWHDPGETA